MTLNHTNESAAFSLEAKQAKTSGEHYTPLGVLSVLAQLGEPSLGGLGDPCCGSGLIVSAEMLNRAHNGRVIASKPPSPFFFTSKTARPFQGN